MVMNDGFNTKKRFEFTDITDKLFRVSAGSGGEPILIKGSEKTALIDCGMAYCGEGLVNNIKKELGDRKLDYVILSHTHYDHVGALPYLRKAWPDIVSFGAVYAKEVLEKESALKRIEKMSEAAWIYYLKPESKPKILMDGLKVDRTISENDVISLGDEELIVYETPGHTDCSLTLLLKPEQILFASESTGVYIRNSEMIIGMLKSYSDTMASIKKCRKINAKYVISPHYGLVPEKAAELYWDYAENTTNLHKDFIFERINKGASFEEIMKDYKKEFYSEIVADEQPVEAFLLNAQHMVQNLIKEFKEL
ncbi:MAG: MBL fold metallo-hydrolase [Anaerovoracaceae bacterium]|jgi:glyoxylase-like metal-dependent hydrolase (beta-lactamase superfamily II)